MIRNKSKRLPGLLTLIFIHNKTFSPCSSLTQRDQTMMTGVTCVYVCMHAWMHGCMYAPPPPHTQPNQTIHTLIHTPGGGGGNDGTYFWGPLRANLAPPRCKFRDTMRAQESFGRVCCVCIMLICKKTHRARAREREGEKRSCVYVCMYRLHSRVLDPFKNVCERTRNNAAQLWRLPLPEIHIVSLITS
jgi:hypothetical protein